MARVTVAVVSIEHGEGRAELGRFRARRSSVPVLMRAESVKPCITLSRVPGGTGDGALANGKPVAYSTPADLLDEAGARTKNSAREQASDPTRRSR